MPALLDLQTAFAEAVHAGRDAAIPERVGGLMADTRRLSIHRNHFYSSLIEAIGLNFATTAALVGEEFMRQTARDYIRATPPERPCLFEYGMQFPAFLESYPPAATLPYLADVARLDLAVTQSYHAADDAGLDPAWFAETPADIWIEETFKLRSDLRVVTSTYPLIQIWRAARGAHEGEIDASTGGGTVLVHRDTDDDAVLMPLGAGMARFLAEIAAGAVMGDALETAQEAHPDWDSAADLPTVLANRWLQHRAATEPETSNQ